MTFSVKKYLATHFFLVKIYLIEHFFKILSIVNLKICGKR